MEQSTSDAQTYAIIGAAIEVHNVRGTGFLEIVYRDCCAIEFQQRNIPFRREVPFPLTYKSHPIGGCYEADFVCYGEIIVEIKAHGVRNLPADHAQLLNYLAASGKERALLLNFGGPKLMFQRFVMSSNRQPTLVNSPMVSLTEESEQRSDGSDDWRDDRRRR